MRLLPREEGCDLTFAVNLETLARHSDRQGISKSLASLYLLTAGLPLRFFLYFSSPLLHRSAAA